MIFSLTGLGIVSTTASFIMWIGFPSWALPLSSTKFGRLNVAYSPKCTIRICCRSKHLLCYFIFIKSKYDKHLSQYVYPSAPKIPWRCHTQRQRQRRRPDMDCLKDSTYGIFQNFSGLKDLKYIIPMSLIIVFPVSHVFHPCILF